MGNWADDEFGGANLGDGRLNLRLIKLATRFAEQPTASIPGACGDWAETMAAYRFFDQASADRRGLNWESILQPHIEGSEARMAQHPVVLCLQDTTELDFDGQETEGLGPLSYEAQRGMYLHPTYAVTPQREPLGSSMPGCGHVSPKAPTERAQGFPRARAGSKVTSGLRRRRQRCGARDGSMWRIAKPTWWA